MADIEIETGMPSTAFEGIMLGAQAAAGQAATSEAVTSASALAAALSAATALTAGMMYVSTAAALPLVAEGAYFVVAGDGTNTYALLYRKTGGVAVEQASYASQAAYQAAGGSTLIGHRWSDDAATRTAADVMRDRGIDLRDAPGFALANPADMSGPLQWAIDQAAATGNVLYLPPGVIYANGLVMRDHVRIVGPGRGFASISNVPGTNRPMWSIPLGVIQHWAIKGLTLQSGGGAGEDCIVMQGVMAADAGAGAGAGAFYGLIEDVQILGFAGHAILAVGGTTEANANNIFQQFITLRQVMALRSATSLYSRSLDLIGNVGQWAFEGACEFDSMGQGAVIAPGVNVSIGRRWQHSDGRLGSAADAYIEGLAGWTPASDIAPYRIDVTGVTVQGSDVGIVIDRAEADLLRPYMEQTVTAVVAMGSASLVVESPIWHNAGGSASSGGSGCLILNDTARVSIGHERVDGLADRLYAIKPGTVPLAFNRHAPALTDSNLPGISTSMVPFLGPVAGGLAVFGNEAVRVNGGGDGGPADIQAITSQHGPGTRLTLQAHYGSLLRLLPGGNIELPSALTLRPLDTVTLELRDNLWAVVSSRIALLIASSVPTTGWYAQGEVVRQAVPASGSPTGWAATASATAPAFVALPNFV